MGKLAEDLSGKSFHDLFVERRVPPKEGSRFGIHVRWLCRCICGNHATVLGTCLRRGVVRSCGCLIKRLAKEKRKKMVGEKFSRLTLIKFESIGSRVRWHCRCACGKKSFVWENNLVRGLTRSCGCLAYESRKKGHCKYKRGDKVVDGAGYVRVKMPDHPNSFSDGYVLEHVLVMSENIGRPLRKGESVHHKNGIRNENSIKNLELWNIGHPAGQRVRDKVRWCVGFLRRHRPDLLSFGLLSIWLTNLP